MCTIQEPIAPRAQSKTRCKFPLPSPWLPLPPWPLSPLPWCFLGFCSGWGALTWTATLCGAAAGVLPRLPAACATTLDDCAGVWALCSLAGCPSCCPMTKPIMLPITSSAAMGRFAFGRMMCSCNMSSAILPCCPRGGLCRAVHVREITQNACQPVRTRECAACGRQCALPWRTATICAMIASAISSGVRAPMSRPMGPWMWPICSSVTPSARNRASRCSRVPRLPIAPT